MKSRILTTIVALLAIVGSATAQTLSVASVEAKKGEQAEIVVSVSGATVMTALQFNMALPEGVAMAGDDATLGAATNSHTLSVQTLNNGDRLIAVYSENLNTFKDGELLRIPVTVGNNATGGEGRLYTVRMATTDAVSHVCKEVTFTVTVKTEPVDSWTDIIAAAGEEKCIYAKEYPAAEGTLVAEVDGVVTVVSPAKAKEDWDSQFWIRFPQNLPNGTKYRISFECKASSAQTGISTEWHGEPGDFKHGGGIGGIDFTEEWNTISKEGYIDANGKVSHSLAFTLSKAEKVTYYFRNIHFEILSDEVTEFDFPGVTALWSGEQVIKDWNCLFIEKETLSNLKVGDLLHVKVKDVTEGATTDNWIAFCSFRDGDWTEMENWKVLAENTTEITYLLTGDVLRFIKRKGMLFTAGGYTITQVFATETSYTGSDNSIWIGNQAETGAIDIAIPHLKNANDKNGLKVGDVIRLTYTGDDGYFNFHFIGEDTNWGWQNVVEIVKERTATGADVRVTQAMVDMLSKNLASFVVSVNGITLTQVELIKNPLTLDMYHEWDGCTATSKVTNEDGQGELHLGESLGSGALVYGLVSVQYQHYADLTGYGALVIEGTPGVELRVLINRLEVGNGGGDDNGGAWTELNPVIGADGTVRVSLADYPFVHLNAIKTGWNSLAGTIISLTLHESITGDVNGDGKVNVGDIMAVINIMSANTNDAKGDVNQDGKVNVGDIMAVINIMAGK